jgi:hypothetical protein
MQAIFKKKIQVFCGVFCAFFWSVSGKKHPAARPELRPVCMMF